MRFVMFYHSLVSDWNHGNAHFLRGIVRELLAGGHDVVVYEPADGWSRSNLLADHGPQALEAFARAYPGLASRLYDLETLDLDQALAGADVVLVHEWNDPALVRALGRHRASAGYRLLFHDTHHRLVSEPEAIERLELGAYDAVVAFGDVLRELYLRRGLCAQVFTWHEGADTRQFYPRATREPEADVLWIGNWGDGERTAELEEFFIHPVMKLGLTAAVYGVRYPAEVRTALNRAGIRYGGWLPNSEVPDVLARHRVAVHVPRRQYTRLLPGIPTIRPFEVLACGAPLVSAPWPDREQLFSPGHDYLVARDGEEMEKHLADLVQDPESAAELGRRGLARIRARHTCAHRVAELLDLLGRLDGARSGPVPGTAHPGETSLDLGGLAS
jgi:spore maturation protein CgeB